MSQIECCVCEAEIEAEALKCVGCGGHFTLPCGYKQVDTDMGGQTIKADVCDICWDETPQGPTNDYYTGICEELGIS